MEHRFVNYIPDYLKENIIYISNNSNIVIHLCACGCKNKVVTPISPIQWSYTYNGESISLSPSIGNWNFDCKSHYWIRDNQIVWAEKWGNGKISEVQKNEQIEIDDFYNKEVVDRKDSSFNKFLKFLKLK
ncbi:DUF6527 family protein [Wenyingzhuangia aestuarii]|uniref:DUF6527 family protein n=1 Tax=Wenyingzhuangia aestuarii TaxID=1647582 RepID=UPI001ADAFE5C|nr:DUF6527 family protein [Wenyingzhuangia aestuarii]NJB82053.1 hypothetical protein [Wenyingzhuangia aestuarii]